MTSIVVNGLSLDKHVKKIYADLLALQQSQDTFEAQTEASPAMVDNVLDKIIADLTKKDIFSIGDELKAFKEKHKEDMASLRRETNHMVAESELKLGKRIDEVEQTILEKMDKRFDKVEHQLMLINNMMEEIDTKFETTNVSLVDIRAVHKNTNEEALNLIEKRYLDVLHEAKGKIADTFHSCDGRIRSLEDNLNTEMNRTTDGFDKFTTKLIDVDTKLEKIFNIAAVKEDVESKADKTELIRKADFVDLSTTNDSLSDLSRRMDFFSSNISDQLKKLGQTTDEKMENRIKYVLEMVRKQRDEGGTDIGKIKCLVCDQPIKQKEAARELEMDAMANTVGTKRRSASPPRERSGKEGVQTAEEEHFYHKSLASLGALPVHDALNSVIQKYAEDQRAVTAAIIEANEEYKRESDFEGVQRNRLDAPMSATELTVPAQVNYPPPPTGKLFAQESKMGRSFKGGNTRNGYATNTGGPPPTSSDYFRSLEMKFSSSASGATGRMRPSTATLERGNANSRSNPLLATKGGASRRPGSAVR